MRRDRPRGAWHLHAPGEAGEDRLIVRHGIRRSVAVVDRLAVLGHETASWSVEASEPESRESGILLEQDGFRLADLKYLVLLEG